MLTGVAAATAASTTAAAQTVSTPEAFVGSASATALTLNLLGIKLTVSQTDASGDSSQKAAADASILAPGSVVTLDDTSVSVPSGANLTATTPACNTTVALPSLITIAALCAQSAAAVSPETPPAACNQGATATAPTSCGSAEVLEIDVGLTQLLQPLLNAVKAATAGLSTTVGNILTNLPVVTPLLNSLLTGPLLGGLGITLADPVGSLIDALNRATELLSIQVLPSVSSISTTPGAFTAASEADGIVVTLLPGVLLGSHLPVLQLKVASGSTTSTYNRSTCESSSKYVAGLLSGELLGTPLNVGTGTLNLGALGSVTLGGGATTQNANGSVGSTAQGLGVNLLGLVSLTAGDASSVVFGACAVVATTTTTAAPVVTTLPPTVVTGVAPISLATTGTSAPLLPIGFMLILAGYLTFRTRRTRRAARSGIDS